MVGISFSFPPECEPDANSNRVCLIELSDAEGKKVAQLDSPMSRISRKSRDETIVPIRAEGAVRSPGPAQLGLWRGSVRRSPRCETHRRALPTGRSASRRPGDLGFRATCLSNS